MQSASSSYLVLKELAGHMPAQLSPLQLFIGDHIDLFTRMWFSVWAMTAIVLLYKLWREYQTQRHGEH